MTSFRASWLQLAFALLVPGVLGTWACGDTSSEKLQAAGLAKGCTLNSDCKDPLVCAFQRCHDECADSRDCPTGQRCVKGGSADGAGGAGDGSGGGVCQLPEETGCTSDSKCGGSQFCAEDRECRDRCTSDDACVDRQTCSLSGGCAEPTELDDNGNLPVAGGGGESGAGGEVVGGAGETGNVVDECPDVGGQPVVHNSETISEPQTWRGLHQVNGLYLQATLTLAPCAIVRFDTSGYVTVAANGSLKALGTPGRPVVFTSARTAPKAGDWGGIQLNADSSNDSTFENVIVEYGGAGTSGITLADGATASFSGVVVRHSSDERCAIGLGNDSELALFENVRTEDSPLGLCVGANVIGAIDSFSSDGPPISVSSNTITRAATWKDLGVPYQMSSSFSVNARLTLDAGVTIKMPATAYLYVNANGALITEGTAASPVTFTSAKSSPAAGDWDQIYILADASNETLLDHTVIEFGGSSNASISVATSATAGFSNLTVLDSGDAGCGIQLASGAVLSAFENVATENVLCPLSVPSGLVGSLGSLTSDGDFIAVGSETLTRPATWPAFGIPYRLSGSMTIQAALQLEAGTAMEMPPGAYLYVQNNGAIQTLGTSADHVTFDSSLDGAVPGDWDGIYLLATAAGTSAFTYTDFVNGGGTNVAAGVLRIDGRSVVLDHATFSNSSGCDVKVTGTNRITDTSSTFVLCP